MSDIRNEFDEKDIHIWSDGGEKHITVCYDGELDIWYLDFNDPIYFSLWQRIKIVISFLRRKWCEELVLKRYAMKKLHEAIGKELKRPEIV